MGADGFSQAEIEERPRKTGPDRPSFGRECPFKLEPAYAPIPPARLAGGLELESAPIRSLGPAPREKAAVMLKAVSFQLLPPLPAFSAGIRLLKRNYTIFWVHRTDPGTLKP